MESHDDTHKVGRWMVYAAWVLFLGLLSWLFSSTLERQHNPNREPASSMRATGVEVVLQRNRWGHYVTTGHINGEAVTFMLDTGATDISVPAELAQRLGLKRGVESTYHTANGPIRVHSTRLERVGIGPIELLNLRAHINPNVKDDEVLLGMTFLKQLEMVQRGNTLTLRYGR
ncbi:MAG: TIGR02281 family clan AA aspartic protease [Proteobacteria bacterium]|nr:TIGR02281 family clan AA aspartic protease [Pseudomonadota bacterium]